MTSTRTHQISTPAHDLKGGDVIALAGKWVEVFDTSRVGTAFMVRFVRNDGEVRSVRLFPNDRVSRRVA